MSWQQHELYTKFPCAHDRAIRIAQLSRAKHCSALSKCNTKNCSYCDDGHCMYDKFYDSGYCFDVNKLDKQRDCEE